MNCVQYHFSSNKGWKSLSMGFFEESHCQLVFAFGTREELSSDFISKARSKFPQARIVSCVSAGQIQGTEIFESGVAVTAIQFSKAYSRCSSAAIDKMEQTKELAAAMLNDLVDKDLTAVLLFSDAQKISASALMKAAEEVLPPRVVIHGGLAANALDFGNCGVGLDVLPSSGTLVAVGIYGEVQVTATASNGYQSFGPARTVTRASGNTLYELDHKPAFEILADYLGEQVHKLPASGLLVPLGVTTGSCISARTPVDYCKEEGSLTFSGEIPLGSTVKLMRTNKDLLLAPLSELPPLPGQVHVVVSCLGRKLALGQRVEEEVEIVAAKIAKSSVLTGFYSLGEFGRCAKNMLPEFYNQTLTILSLSEV